MAGRRTPPLHQEETGERPGLPAEAGFDLRLRLGHDDCRGWARASIPRQRHRWTWVPYCGSWSDRGGIHRRCAKEQRIIPNTDEEHIGRKPVISCTPLDQPLGLWRGSFSSEGDINSAAANRHISVRPSSRSVRTAGSCSGLPSPIGSPVGLLVEPRGRRITVYYSHAALKSAPHDALRGGLLHSRGSAIHGPRRNA